MRHIKLMRQSRFVRRALREIRKLLVIEHSGHELNCPGSFVQIAKPLLRELRWSLASLLSIEPRPPILSWTARIIDWRQSARRKSQRNGAWMIQLSRIKFSLRENEPPTGYLSSCIISKCNVEFLKIKFKLISRANDILFYSISTRGEI